MKVFLMVFFLLVLITGGTYAYADVSIIVNNKTGVSNINKEEAREIFLGTKKVWDDNSKIVIFLLDNGEAYKKFFKKLVYKNPSQLRRYWKRQQFLGKSSSVPKMCKSEEEMVKLVSETSGSIGYITADTDISNKNVKRFSIN